MWQPEPLRISPTAPSWANEKQTLESRLTASGPWFHSLLFDNGARTPGRDPSDTKLRAIQLPSDLSGYTLLDVGSYEGFFSFHAAQRGARVTSSDHFVWHSPEDPSRRNFDLAHVVVGSPCEVLDVDVPELPSLAAVGRAAVPRHPLSPAGPGGWSTSSPSGDGSARHCRNPG